MHWLFDATGRLSRPWLGARNVIEPVIGHTKRDGFLERNTPGPCPLCLCPDRELEIATRKRRAARAEQYCAQ